MPAPAAREIVPLATDWRFVHEDHTRGARPELDDSGWETVRVPHDWAIAGTFEETNDRTFDIIHEDGENRPSYHTGRTGALPHVGVGWYRRRFHAPEAWTGKRVFVEIDGAMSNSTVHCNGQYAGAWPYGYASFRLELTRFLRFGEENLLAVRLDNKPCASRWYPGAGLYRNVRLVVLDPVHVDHWGTFVTTPYVTDAEAHIRIATTLRNQNEAPVEGLLTTVLQDPGGNEVARAESGFALPADARDTVKEKLAVPAPQVWDLETPHLYRAISTVTVDGHVRDTCETTFGIRSIAFDPETGFSINGRREKLNGVCMHHDLGLLGAAVHLRALHRQLEILQSMGCNAIRTSHNPPAPELLDLCDRMGLLVIDEAFDEWRRGKVDYGYHVHFDAWAEQDLRAMIRRDRNHPCIILWSIGNEIGEQNTSNGAEVGRYLTAIVHDEDTTRPTTAGFNFPDGAIENGLADAVDIPGWNYKPRLYARYHADHPTWAMVGSETESCVSSRGFYRFPVEAERNVTHDDLQVSSYDVAAPGWGCSPDTEFAAQEDCPFVCGEFVWTGFDYLGEPTPYKTEWPSRSSYFGIVDLCGLPKDRFYLYQSHWSDREVLHLLPHWTWPGREGEPTPVHCYTSYNAAELFVNGVSQGIRRKNQNFVTVPFRGPDGRNDAMEGVTLGRYRLVWEDVRYAPGKLNVVALDDDGRPAAEHVVRTAGEPHTLHLEVDRNPVCADAEDAAFVTVSVRDRNGTLCPNATHRVRFSVAGPGRLLGVGSGDPTSTSSFQAGHCELFHGLAMAVVGAEDGASEPIALRADAEGLEPAEVRISLQAGRYRAAVLD